MIRHDAYIEYKTKLERLEKMWKEGLGETPPADELRESMDEPWNAMTLHEREAIQEAKCQ